MKGNTQNRIDKFLKDIGIYAIGNLGSKLITFMLVPLYTHYITNTDEFGYYDICLTVIFLFIPFVTLQLRDGAFRFLLDCNTNSILRISHANHIHIDLRNNSFNHFIFYKSRIFMVFFIIAMCNVFLWGNYTSNTRIRIHKSFCYYRNISSFCIGIFSILFVVLLNMGITGIFLANILARIVALI